MLVNRPRASAELKDGYAYTAYLAECRRDRVAAWGDDTEAAAWNRVAEYCRDMAKSMARDDDQFRFQRDKQRRRREIPMSAAEMGMVVMAGWGERVGRQLPEWQQVVLDLALGYLSPMQRVCFELVVGGRLTINEVAEAVNATPVEVRNHLMRARRRIERDVWPKVEPIVRENKRFCLA